jgi:hypothetical protein
MFVSKTPKILLITIAVVLILLLVFWRYLFLLPALFHQKVNLPSGIYLPSPSVYLSSEINYDPLHPPLDSGISYISVDRPEGHVDIHFQKGEPLNVQLGKARRVIGCEHQFSMEYFQLSVKELHLGSVLVRNPILMVSCEMWAWTEKIRPAKLVLREGPLPDEDDAFMFGTECANCLYFGQAFGTLNEEIVDGTTGNPLPDAHITLTNRMGEQNFEGKFTLPLYAGIQIKYRISTSGYPEITGEISNLQDAKLFIISDALEGQTNCSGGIFDMPPYNEVLDFSFPMATFINPLPVFPTATCLPTSFPIPSATPLP